MFQDFSGVHKGRNNGFKTSNAIDGEVNEEYEKVEDSHRLFK